ncbi:hypothetical protein OH77DRAFT_1092961 [Trametes cingulata]|nr:hypothetical protein OH77DRAFT_1092961 [Trametes cingulata]
MSLPTTIYAKERGSAPSADKPEEEARVVYLDVPIPPHEPIHVGQKVRISSITSCDELFPTEEETNAHHYTAEDLGVWGTIVRMRSEEEEVVEFILRNDNIKSNVVYAYLTVPREEGLMIRTPPWRRWLNAIIARPERTRTIRIEDDATVFGDTTTLNFTAPINAVGATRRRRNERERG